MCCVHLIVLVLVVYHLPNSSCCPICSVHLLVLVLVVYLLPTPSCCHICSVHLFVLVLVVYLVREGRREGGGKEKEFWRVRVEIVNVNL